MAENNSDKRTVVVNIGGKDFKIKGDAGEDFLRKLADYVDGKIKEIKDKTDIVDMQSLAVLASLNIAEELHNLREEKVQAETQTAEKSQAEIQAAAKAQAEARATAKDLEEKLREMVAAKSQAETQAAAKAQAETQAAQKELEEKLREMTAEADKYLAQKPAEPTPPA